MIDLTINGKDCIFMATETTLFIAEGVRWNSDSFIFDPNKRIEIHPFSWKTIDITPLAEHECQLRQLAKLHFFNAAGQEMKEAN